MYLFTNLKFVFISFTIYSKFECFTADRLQNFTVAVGDDVRSRDSFDPEIFTRCVYVEECRSAENCIIPCDRPVRGQYVAVYMERKEVLTLCEVEVYGVPVKGKY